MATAMAGRSRSGASSRRAPQAVDGRTGGWKSTALAWHPAWTDLRIVRTAPGLSGTAAVACEVASTAGATWRRLYTSEHVLAGAAGTEAFCPRLTCSAGENLILLPFVS